MPTPPAAFAVIDWPARPPDRHPDTLRWIALIEAVRDALPPACPACRERPYERRAESPPVQDRAGGAS